MVCCFIVQCSLFCSHMSNIVFLCIYHCICIIIKYTLFSDNGDRICKSSEGNVENITKSRSYELFILDLRQLLVFCYLFLTFAIHIHVVLTET